MILVVAEHHDGRIHPASWEAIAAAQQLAHRGAIVVALLAGSADAAAAAAATLAAADVHEVVVLTSPLLEMYTADGYTTGLQELSAARSPSLIVLPHTYQTRDFAPRLAGRLDRALVTDVIAMREEADRLLLVRPVFQGKMLADVVALGPGPHLVTVQIGAYSAGTLRQGVSPAAVTSVTVSLTAAAIRQQPEPPFRQARQAVDLSQAERIVSVGRGIKAQEHIALAQKLADALRAELAASRPICDAGWLPMERQVGSSGQTVAPKLYFALGISGAIQHVVGMKGARTIVAINKDADAPIFELADFGIVGDLFELVPAIVKALEP